MFPNTRSQFILIFVILSLQNAKIAFESIEFSTCLGKWKCDFIAVLDLKSIFSPALIIVCFVSSQNPNFWRENSNC